MTGWPADDSRPQRGVWTLSAHDVTWQMHRGWRRLDQTARNGYPYELDLLERIRDLDLTGVAVDVGGNVGVHTMWMAAVCGLRVHAFEPVWHQWLIANVALNQLDGRVTVHDVALGQAKGAARHLRRGRLCLALPSDEDWDGRFGIPVATLDSYGLDDVSVVKVDVEGWEPMVLRGARATLARCRPVVFAEEWDDAAHIDVARVLEPVGYGFVGRVVCERGVAVGEWQPT